VLPAIVPGINHLFINLNSWNKLPKNIQSLLEEVARDAEEKMVTETINDEAALLKDVVSKGVNIYQLPSDELERWKKAVMPTWDWWLNEQAKKSDVAVAAIKLLKDNQPK